FENRKPLSIFTALPVAYRTYNSQRATELFNLLAANRTAVLPTLFVLKTAFAELKESDHSRDALLAFIDPKIQATYQRRINDAKKQSEETTRFWKKLMEKFMEMVPQMQAAGVTLLAGSDCGPYNSFVYPGEALHEELKLLVASGLTPIQALQAATINAAKFMDADKFYGNIQKGKSSDMVMLDANPLKDIKAIDHIHMVLCNGQLYSKKDLTDMLQAIKH
ncbi:MAG TPA: amidohydrolase family protein, partial [Chitinophagaceae bacterium]|nr:amidohydrolase family protein [Chitinophagaceae bacterium]